MADIDLFDLQGSFLQEIRLGFRILIDLLGRKTHGSQTSVVTKVLHEFWSVNDELIGADDREMT